MSSSSFSSIASASSALSPPFSSLSSSSSSSPSPAAAATTCYRPRISFSSCTTREISYSLQSLLKDIAPTDRCACYVHLQPSSLRRPVHFPPSLKQVFAQHFFKYKRQRDPHNSSFTVPCVVSPAEGEAIAFGYPQDWPRGLSMDLLQYDWVKVLLEFDYNISPTSASQNTPQLSGLSSTVAAGHEYSFSPTSPLSGSHLNRVVPTYIPQDSLIKVEFAQYSVAGQRTYNEDRLAAIAPMDIETSFFGVYDGHNGEAAAEYAKDNLHRLVLLNRQRCSSASVQDVLEASFQQFDDIVKYNIMDRYRIPGTRPAVIEVDAEERLLPYDFDKEYDDDVSSFSSGCTACTCLINRNHYTIANVGDSRVVMSRGGHAYALSRDHRLNYNKEEQERILQCGVSFDHDGYLDGSLSVSRALGDFDKVTGTKIGGLSAVPDITEDNLRIDDEFMIIACDGVFDVMTNQEAVTVVQSKLRESGDLREAIRELCELAYKRRSLDNLSAVIILFKT